MNSHTHTPGPWVVAGGDSAPLLHVYGPDDRGLFHQMRPLAEQEANARLIAAAPELLGALRMVLGKMGDWNQSGETVLQIKAAIAKAEGR